MIPPRLGSVRRTLEAAAASLSVPGWMPALAVAAAVCLPFCPGQISAQVVSGSVDTTFTGSVAANGSVTALATQSDGKVLVAGVFDMVDGFRQQRITRLDTDGIVDPSFTASLDINGTISAIALQNDGEDSSGRSFASFNGQPAANLVRLNNDGTIDTEFSPDAGTDDIVRAIAVQPNDQILIGGDFQQVNNQPHRFLARLNSDGTYDDAFNQNDPPDDIVEAIAVQPDGGVLVGGYFFSISGASSARIARLGADGTIDPTFMPGTSANGPVLSILTATDGTIYIGGAFTLYNGGNVGNFARLGNDGTLDTAFSMGSGANAAVTEIVEQLNQQILIGGAFTAYNGTPAARVARLNIDGTLDTTFNHVNPGSDPTVDALAIANNGSVLVGGSLTNANVSGVAASPLISLRNDGSQDSTVHSVITQPGSVVAVKIQPDGKLVIGGNLDYVNGLPISGIARVNADGSVDVSFSPGTAVGGAVTSLALQGDGKILFTSSATGGTMPSNVVRLNADGSLDSTFRFGGPRTGNIFASALQSDGKLVIAGAFPAASPGLPVSVERLNADGSIDGTFAPNISAGASFSSIAIQPDGKILLGGEYISGSNGGDARELVRLNTDGTVDTAFAVTPAGNSATLRTIVLQPDGKILLGGVYAVSEGPPSFGVTRLNPDGTRDTGFNIGEGFIPDPATNFDVVFALALQSDGKILVGGNFVFADAQMYNRLARLNTDGSVDSSFDSGTGVASPVYSLALQADGKVIVGGMFSQINGQPEGSLARLNNALSMGQGNVSFTSATFQANENAGTATITVQRTGGSVGNISVNYSTVDDTAIDGINYTGTSGTLVWTDGDASTKAFSVPVTDDGFVDPDTTVQLILSGPAGGATIVRPNPATLTISNTDTGLPTPSPTPTPVTPPPSPSPVPGVALAITSPPANASVVSGAPLSLAASVLDPGQTLTRVQFFLNGQPFLQFPLTGPYVLHTTAPAPGTYDLELMAVDNFGNLTSVSRTLTVVAALASEPLATTSLLTDLGGRTLKGGTSITLTALADSRRTDGGLLARVDFYTDDTLLASYDGSGKPIVTAGAIQTSALTTTAPAPSGTVFRAGWTIPAVDKLVNLTTVATTVSGRAQVSSPVTVRITTDAANRPPVVTVSGITDGAQLPPRTTLTIPVVATDPDAPVGGGQVGTNPGSVVSRVEYYLNQTKLGTSLQGNFTFSVTPPAVGTYVLNTIVTDGAGLSGLAAPAIFQIVNSTVVTLTEPNGGIVIEGGDALKLKLIRTGDLSRPLTVTYRTKNGGNVPGVDYRELTGTVTIPAGRANTRIRVRAFDDGVADGDKTLKVILLPSADGAYSLAKPARAKVRIIDVN